jgi:hypothetical protein
VRVAPTAILDADPHRPSGVSSGRALG